MRLEEKIVVDASCEEVWELLADPADMPSFVPAITRFERQDEERGARRWARATRC